MKKKNRRLSLVVQAISKNPAVTEERIRCRAYEIFKARGGTYGHSLEDWFQAERELTGGR